LYVPDIQVRPRGRSVPRETLIASATVLKSVGQGELSTLLLKWDIKIQGPSLASRVFNFARYALEHPDLLVDEGKHLDLAIVLRAAELVNAGPHLAHVSERERNECRKLLEAEGFVFDDSANGPEPFLHKSFRDVPNGTVPDRQQIAETLNRIEPILRELLGDIRERENLFEESSVGVGHNHPPGPLPLDSIQLEISIETVSVFRTQLSFERLNREVGRLCGLVFKGIKERIQPFITSIVSGLYMVLGKQLAEKLLHILPVLDEALSSLLELGSRLFK
jgi:hypothetical protein